MSCFHSKWGFFNLVKGRLRGPWMCHHCRSCWGINWLKMLICFPSMQYKRWFHKLFPLLWSWFAGKESLKITLEVFLCIFWRLKIGRHFWIQQTLTISIKTISLSLSGYRLCSHLSSCPYRGSFDFQLWSDFKHIIIVIVVFFLKFSEWVPNLL